MHVGIDFGTSNSSAAVFAGGSSRLVPLDPAARNLAVMPSLLYLGRDGSTITGRRALRVYHAVNTGRPAKLVRVQVGVLKNTFAEIGDTYTDVFVWLDENEPGRLFQAMKMALRDRNYRGTSVYGTPYSLEDLVATFLRDVRERVERETGEGVERAVFGRPVHYSAEAGEDALAARRMRAACELAGFRDVRLLEEPVGAALSYGATITEARNVLVFDFGGGTLDVTVMELRPNGRHQVLATGGTPIGGEALNRTIMRAKLLRLFGVDDSVGGKGLAMPARAADLLLSWQTIPQLMLPVNAAIMELIRNQRIGPAAQRFRALECLITRNYGLPLVEAIEEAKVRLSSEPEIRVEFSAEAIVVDEPIARREFEAMIGDELRMVDACVADTLAASGLRAEQMGAVLRTGGSSAIPAFIRLLAERFGPEKVLEHHVFTGVTEGLALAAAQEREVARA